MNNKILNCGNLTGQNFTENALVYDHYVQIIDTETLKVDFYINPYAFNFYKIDCTNTASFEGAVKTMFEKQLKPNPVITLKVLQKDVSCARQLLKEFPNIICRLIVEASSDSISTDEPILEATDHLKQFEQYVLENIGNTDIIKEELMSVMR